ncbi:MAG: hypothetical protein ACE5DL_05855 [Nitrosopumilaceae archaeon]
MNNGRKLLFTLVIMGISYSQVFLVIFGVHPSFLNYDSFENSATQSLVLNWTVPLVRVFTYDGFAKFYW